jgi:hypothetical protein
VICPERNRLTEELGAVIKRILELHSQEAEALIAGDISERPPLVDELKQFQAKRADLLARIRTHAAEHGC